MNNNNSINKKKNIIITGFGKFCGVPTNPSNIIVNDIERYINDLPNKNELKFNIINSEIVEVSGIECKNYLNKIENLYLKNQQDNSDKPILIHLGVSSKETENRLEQFGWNLADFRCNDENGWQPNNEAIQVDNKNEKYETNLPIFTLIDKLKSLNYKVRESDDPGRFVCNYLYFLSLKLSKSYNTDSLFVHIPNFEELDKEIQLKFFVDLLNLIAIETM